MYEYHNGGFYGVSLGEYKKQLNIQKFYLIKFCNSYAGPYMRNVCTDYLYHLNKEIENVDKLIEIRKNKYKQERLDI